MINKRFNVLAFITAPLTIVMLAYCVLFEKAINSNLRILLLVPFVYLLGIFFVSYRNNNINGLAYNIIHIIMFIRYVLTVLVTITGLSYDGIIKSADSLFNAVFLMIYEMIVVFIVMRKCSSRIQEEEYALYDSNNHHNIVINFFEVLCVLIFLYAIIALPYAREKMFNFSVSSSGFKGDDEALSGFIFVFFTIGLYVAYSIIIERIVRHKRKENSSFVFAAFVSVLFISSSWTVDGSISRWGLLVSLLVSYCVLIKAYPQKRKILYIIGGSSFILIMLLSSFAKLYLHHGASNSEALIEMFSASYLNEYFQGVYPVENGLAAMQANASRINYITFFDDTISAYPIINHLFYEKGNLTQLYYQTFLGREDKILPTICQGFAYLGYFGAPFFSGILAYIALTTEKLIKKSKDILATVAYSGITIWCSLFMAVNPYIIQRKTMYFVLVLIIIWIDKHVIIRRGYD